MNRIWLARLGVMMACAATGCTRGRADDTQRRAEAARLIHARAGQTAGEARGATGGRLAGPAGEDDDAFPTGTFALGGQMLVAPCLRDTGASTCATVSAGAACPSTAAGDLPVRGAVTTDTTVALLGNASDSYRVYVHVQGEVEPGAYTGGSEAVVAAPSGLNGWRAGGAPAAGAGSSVFMLRVTDAASGARSDYFLNALAAPAAAGGTYPVDYVASFTAAGGSSVRLVAADPDCAIAKNCGPAPQAAGACAAPVVPTRVDVELRRRNPQFAFDASFNGQWIGVSLMNIRPL